MNMTNKKTNKTKNAKAVEDFLATFAPGVATNQVDLPTRTLERDTIHTFRVLDVAWFEGTYGPSVCVEARYEDDTEFKTYFNGYERDALKTFLEDKGNGVGLDIRVVRTQRPSKANPDRTYNMAVFALAE
jgi:hypothetical protein